MPINLNSSRDLLQEAPGDDLGGQQTRTGRDIVRRCATMLMSVSMIYTALRLTDPASRASTSLSQHKIKSRALVGHGSQRSVIEAD